MSESDEKNIIDIIRNRPSTSIDSSNVEIYRAAVPKRIQLQFIADDGEVNAVNWSPIKHIVATGGSDRIVKLWDVRKSKMIPHSRFTGCNAAINSIAFDSKGLYLLSTSNDASCRIWTMCDKKLRHTLTGHNRKVTSAKFLDNDGKVVTGGYDRMLKVWNLQTKSCIKTITTASGCNDLVILFSDIIISGHNDMKIRFFDTRNDKAIHELTLDAKITSLDISKDNWHLLSCDRNDTIHLFDLRKYKIINTFKHDNFKVCSDLSKAAFDRNVCYIAAGSSDGTIFIWNTNGALETILKTNTQASVTSIAWDPFEPTLASINRTRMCTIWCES